MKSQVRVQKSPNLHDFFIGCLFMIITSFFITSVINAKIVDNSIYQQQTLAKK